MRMIALVALVAATPVLAQEPPTPISPSAIEATGIGITSGTFGDPHDVDTWSARLNQGQDYAFGVRGTPYYSNWRIKGPSGAVIWSDGTGENGGTGTEFRAGTTGTFLFEGRAVSPEAAWYPAKYEFRLHPDCRDDAKTKCQIRPGATQPHALAHGEEEDWVKLASVVSGKTYTATVASCPINPALEVLTGSGSRLARSETGTLTFKAPSVTAWLKVDGEVDHNGCGYSLTLR
jgi:hypothetical protein